jgi:arginine-tRNA-protein transferase
MKNSGIHFPDSLSAKDLDAFLSYGWYRMGQGIFTTSYIMQEQVCYRVFWLRYSLSHLQENEAAKKIQKINRNFTVDILPLVITNEMEELFSLYKTGISFETSPSVKNWLYDDLKANVYDSYVVEVRDDALLIAAGIFDKGHMSIAGILNFYHPDYKKHSLGKFLMLQKINFAKQHRLLWYYPGYIVHGYPKFDYKLFAGKTASQLYSPELGKWFFYKEGLGDILAREIYAEDRDTYPL